MDTTNDCIVSASSRGVTILMPPIGPMPKEQALRLAAWLVAIADPIGEEFEKVLEAVRNT